MKLLRKLSVAAALLAAATLVATFPVESSFASRSKMVQRVLKSEQSELFGEVGENIGSPQEMVIDDPKAFLDKDLPDGTKQVDEKYLQDNKIYPLQLQTVVATLGYVRIGALTIGLLALIAAVRTGRKTTNTN